MKTNINKTIEVLRSLSGNKQIDFLKENNTNELLQEILYYTYNPHLNYKIKQKSIDKIGYSYGNETITFDLWKDYAKYLEEFSEKSGITHNEIEELLKFVSIFKKDDAEILICVLNKDLRMNLSSKTINKVFKNLIPEFKVMLADKYKGKMFKNTYVSRKYDGLRCIFYKVGKDIKAFSRNGKEFKHFGLIKEDIKEFLDVNANLVFDGEIIYLNDDGSEDFKKAISSAHCKNISEFESGLKYVIFDCMSLECFIEKDKNKFLKFEDSYKNLVQDLEIKKDNNKLPKNFYYNTKFDKLLLATQINIGNDVDKMLKLSKKASEYNWEGLMLRNGNETYDFKRTKNLLKVKKFYDSEFEILDFVEGAGKYKGKLGSIVIKFRNNTVEVGSGYTDLERDLIWINRKKILDKKLELKVQYFEITEDKKGNNSLRFPTFKGFRNIDKDEINIEEF